jgi:hypothetical protein
MGIGLKLELAILALLALLPAALIAISWQRITRPKRLQEAGRRLHRLLLLLQTLCYGTLVVLAVVLHATQFIVYFMRSSSSFPLCSVLGIACLSSIAFALRRGPLRWILVANGLVILWDFYCLLAAAVAGWSSQM